jgi:hypothetical protein
VATRDRIPRSIDDVKATMSSMVEGELGAAVIRALHRQVSEDGAPAAAELRTALREALLRGSAGSVREMLDAACEPGDMGADSQNDLFRDTG